MANHFISELLVLFLLLLSSSRFLFIKEVQSDALAIVPLVAFLVSVLNILAWGLTAFDFLISALALFVAIWNVRALLRFLSHLVIDHYGFSFVLISIVNMVLVIACLVLAVYFRPALVSLKKYGVTLSSTSYHGNFKEGFNSDDNPLKVNTAQVWKYEKTDKEESVEKNKVILFIPSKLSAPEVYEAVCAKLAKDGFLVYVGEFNTPEQKYFGNSMDFRSFRRFGFNYVFFKRGEEEYKKILKDNRSLLIDECNSLIKLSGVREEDFVFFVTEKDDAEIFIEVQEANRNLLDGCYEFAETSAYNTKGFGPIENTEPLTARFMGVERDGSLYMSSHMASELEKAFSMAEEVSANSQASLPSLAVDENKLQ